jgi:hypothetical protein
MTTQHPTELCSPIEERRAAPENTGEQPNRNRFDWNTITMWLFVACMLICGLIAAYELWAKVTGHATP